MLKIFAVIIFLMAGFIFLRPREEFPKTFPQFTTVDLYGNVITNKIFEGKITAILLWTTNSPPCIEVLKNLDVNLPQNFQIIGLIGDKNFDAAQIKKFSSILQLQVNDDFAPLLTKIKVVPTVIFIDKQGNLIESPQFVSDSKFIREELIRLSELNLPKVKTLRLLQEKFF